MANNVCLPPDTISQLNIELKNEVAKIEQKEGQSLDWTGFLASPIKRHMDDEISSIGSEELRKLYEDLFASFTKLDSYIYNLHKSEDDSPKDESLRQFYQYYKEIIQGLLPLAIDENVLAGMVNIDRTNQNNAQLLLDMTKELNHYNRRLCKNPDITANEETTNTQAAWPTKLTSFNENCRIGQNELHSTQQLSTAGKFKSAMRKIFEFFGWGESKQGSNNLASLLDNDAFLGEVEGRYNYWSYAQACLIQGMRDVQYEKDTVNQDTMMDILSNLAKTLKVFEKIEEKIEYICKKQASDTPCWK